MLMKKAILKIIENFITEHKQSKDSETKFKVALICESYLNVIVNNEILIGLSKIIKELENIKKKL